MAIDLGLGQPAEHMLRSALIATRLADRLGLPRAQRDCIYYSTLIMWIGCHADSHEYARWFGDDISVRRSSYLVDWSGLPYQRFLLTNIRHGESVLQRLRTISTLYLNARGHISNLIHSHCTSAALLAERIGLASDVQTAVRCTFERFDGGGLPEGAAGEQIPIEMRVAPARGHGGGAPARVRHLRVRWRWRAAAEAASSTPPSWTRSSKTPSRCSPFLRPEMCGRTALQHAPDRHTRLDEQALDALLVAIGDFVDLKCPFTLGHSRAIAQLAADAAVAVGLDADDVALTRRAAHIHDIGRIGVSNQIWSKPGDLTMAEFERMRLHPYLTERILSSGSRPEGGGVGCRQSSRVPERLRVSARAVGATADDAGPAGRVPRSATSRRWSRGRIARRCRRRAQNVACANGSAMASSTRSPPTRCCTRRVTRRTNPSHGPTA